MLNKEDYEEPRCVLCDKPTDTVKPIPVQRILEKMDEYMGRHDYTGAERHLKYWLEEAKVNRDQRGEISMHNEMMGFYRKTANGDEAISHAQAAIRLLDETNLTDTISAGTTFVNSATVYDAFGKAEESLPLFEKAKEIYEKHLESTDARLGGLYNNMALTLVALERYDEADVFYRKALNIMEKNPNGELEMAITYLNMADAVSADCGLEASEEVVNQYLDKASELLDTPSVPRNGYYAFVCEKCAPTFGYYGYFLKEQELKETAKRIYEGN